MSTGSPSVLSSTGSPGQSTVQLSEPYSRLSALAAKNELGDVLLALEAEMDGKDDRADELEAQLRLNETAQSEAIAAKEKEWHESDAALRAEVLRLQRELEQQGQAVEETEDDASEWRIKYEESEIQKIEFEKELITAREAHAQELAAVREQLGAQLAELRRALELRKQETGAYGLSLNDFNAVLDVPPSSSLEQNDLVVEVAGKKLGLGEKLQDCLPAGDTMTLVVLRPLLSVPELQKALGVTPDSKTYKLSVKPSSRLLYEDANVLYAQSLKRKTPREETHLSPRKAAPAPQPLPVLG